MSAPVIELRQASRMWAADAGLHPIDLVIDAGEVVAVRGRSGSGKSTLLALVAGLCTPDAGEVRVLGEAPHAEMPWERLAIVPQVLAMPAELTIRESIADAGRGDPIEELLVRLDLSDLADRTIGEISMGQQQRAAVARALVARPAVLLADEPTSFQDGDHTATVIDALRAAAAAGTGVLVVTHEDAVTSAADRVIDLAAH